MGKDKSAQERLAYDREIAKKEREIGEKLLESQKAQKMLDRFGDECEKGFQRIQELNEEQMKYGSRGAQWAENEDGGKRRYLSRLVVKQKEGIVLACRNAVQNLEEDRLRLQKKRGEL